MKKTFILAKYMLNNDINFSFSNNLKPETGCLLLSDPFMSEDYFERSVIFLCQYSEEGSFGFILNKPVEDNIIDKVIFGDLPNQIFGIGGPINTDQLFVLHLLGDEIKDGEKITDKLTLGGNFDDIKSKIIEKAANHNKALMFYGYSGWTTGQLDEEIERKNWVVFKDFKIDDLFKKNQSEIYSTFMKKMGKKYELLSLAPLNPNLN